MRRVGLVLGIAMALGACGDDDSAESGADSAASSGGMTSAGTTAGTTTTTGGGGTMETGAAGCVDPSGNPMVEAMTLTTTDGKSIAANVARPEQGSCLPGVVLIHQFQRNKEQWDAQIPEFVAAGYVVIAIDLRGHGASDPPDGALGDVLTDPDGAPNDVRAAVDFLRGASFVDAQRIATVGTSIGANLAVVAMTQLDVQVAVPVSARLDPINALAGAPADLRLTNVSCYAGELDGGGDQAATCDSLTTMASGTTAQMVFPATAAHGVDIFADFPQVTQEIVGFLGANL